MKRIITSILLIMFILIVSLVFIGESSASTTNENAATKPAKESSVTYSNSSRMKNNDELVNYVYKSHGFNENDKREEISDIALLNEKSGKSVVNSSNNDKEKIKTYIYDRMLNSIDYFNSLQATYYFVPSTGDSYYSTYCIQQDNPKSKELIYNEEGELVSCDMFDGEHVVTYNGDSDNIRVDVDSIVNHKNRINELSESIRANRDTISLQEITNKKNNPYYEKYSVDIEEQSKLDFVSLVDSRKRIKYLEDEEDYCYYYRSNLPQLSVSYEQYFPQAYAFGFLADFEKWDVVRTDRYLDRNCLVISGEITGEYSEKMKTQKFEIWVDKEIGAILSFEGYNGDGDLKVFMTTKEFVVDEKIDESVFEDI